MDRAEPSSPNAASARGPGPNALLDRLATQGDEVFESRFVGKVRDAVLFVGSSKPTAVAYLCDPLAGSRWFTGTVDGAQIRLADHRGGRITGTVGIGRDLRLDARISGLHAYDGPVTLAAAGANDLLLRQSGVISGDLVGGFVLHDAVVRGVMVVAASAATSTAVPTGTRPLGMGLRVQLGSPLELTVATSGPVSAELQERAGAEARAALEELRSEVPRGGGVDSQAVIEEMAVAIVVAVFTFGAGGALIAAAVAAAGAIIGQAVSAGDLESALARLDPTLNDFLAASLVTIGTRRSSAALRDARSSTSRMSTLPAGAVPTLDRLSFKRLSGSL